MGEIEFKLLVSYLVVKRDARERRGRKKGTTFSYIFIAFPSHTTNNIRRSFCLFVILIANCKNVSYQIILLINYALCFGF